MPLQVFFAILLMALGISQSQMVICLFLTLDCCTSRITCSAPSIACSFSQQSRSFMPVNTYPTQAFTVVFPCAGIP